MHKACLVAIAVVVLGCATARPIRCPAEGGRRWLELRSPHFVLSTDLASDEARETLERLERSRSALLATAWPESALPLDASVDVVVFADPSDMTALFTERAQAWAFSGRLPPMLLFAGAPSNSDRHLWNTPTAVQHELAHYIGYFLFLRQPKWFAEGLAMYLETLKVSADGREAVVGALNERALELYRAYGHTVRLADLLKWRGDDELDARARAVRYAKSWALMFWLFNEHRDEAEEMLRRLAQAEAPEAAFATAFPAATIDEVDRALWRYFERGTYSQYRVTLPALPSAAIAERKLDSASVHALHAELAQLAAAAVGRSEALASTVDGDLALARRHDPTNVALLYVDPRTPARAEKLEAARAAVAGHPEDGRAWIALADALGDDFANIDEISEAALRATKLLPSHAGGWFHLARAQAGREQLEAALESADKAIALAPLDPGIRGLEAFILAAAGHCDQAEEAVLMSMRLAEAYRPTVAAKGGKAMAEAVARCRAARTSRSR